MVNELIAECTDYNVKISLETKKPKSWLKTVSAFANGIGGKIFFGVDEDKRIHNITNPQEVIEKITDFIDKNITPAPLYKITPFKEFFRKTNTFIIGQMSENFNVWIVLSVEKFKKMTDNMKRDKVLFWNKAY